MTNTAPVGAFRGAGRPEAAALLERLHRPRRRRARPGARGDPAPQPHPQGRVPLRDPHRADLRRRRLRAAARPRRCGSPTSTRCAPSRRAGVEAGDEQLLGIGISTYVEITGFGGTELGSVRIEPDGSATVMSGTSAHGQGHATSFSMIVADRLGIPIERIRYVQSDTARGPDRRRHRRLAVAAARRQRRRRPRPTRSATRRASSRPSCSRRRRRRRADRRRVRASPACPTPRSTGPTLAARTPTSAAAPLHVAARLTAGGRDVPVRRARRRSSRWTPRPGGSAAAARRGRRLRPGGQPADRRGPAARRHRAGHLQALWEQFVYAEDGTPLTSTFADYPMPTAADTISFEAPTPRPRRRSTSSAPRASGSPRRSARRPPCRTPSSTRSATSGSATSTSRARRSGSGGPSRTPAPAAPRPVAGAAGGLRHPRGAAGRGRRRRGGLMDISVIVDNGRPWPEIRELAAGGRRARGVRRLRVRPLHGAHRRRHGQRRGRCSSATTLLGRARPAHQPGPARARWSSAAPTGTRPSWPTRVTALDHVSGGRAIAGLGAGWQVNEHAAYGIDLLAGRGPVRPVRGERGRGLRRCCASGRSTFDGRLLPAARRPQPARAAPGAAAGPGRRRRREADHARRRRGTPTCGTSGARPESYAAKSARLDAALRGDRPRPRRDPAGHRASRTRSAPTAAAARAVPGGVRRVRRLRLVDRPLQSTVDDLTARSG